MTGTSTTLRRASRRDGWRRGLLFGLIVFALLVFGLNALASAAPQDQPQPAATIPAVRPQPPLADFTLADTGSQSRRLSQFRGRPVALFFLCGCPWCQACAQTWGQFQRGGALAPPANTSTGASASLPITLVVFSGDAPATQAFASQAGLDPAQTVLLPDPDLRVTAAAQADPCPRIFVLDTRGGLRYTNNHKDDAARQAPALAIASRALDALRAGDTPPQPVQPASLAETGEAASDEAAASLPLVSPPVFTLPVTAPDGRPLDLATRPGWKVLYFWSATCPCVRACESFTFIPLARRYRGQVSFYAVASNGYDLTLPPGQLARQVRQHGLPFPVLLDTRHRVALALGAKVTPQAFLLDPKNRVVFAGLPDDSRRYKADVGHWGVSRTYLAQAIAQALAGQPVAVPRVKDEGCIIAW